MGNAGADRALRVVDPFERVAGTEAGLNALRQADPSEVRGKVADRLISVELAVAIDEIGEKTGKEVAPWKDGDSDDYADNCGFTD